MSTFMMALLNVPPEAWAWAGATPLFVDVITVSYFVTGVRLLNDWKFFTLVYDLRAPCGTGTLSWTVCLRAFFLDS